MRIPFFRIFYSTAFTVLALIFLALLLVTPGDAIYQSFKNNQIYNVFIIAGVHLLTFLVAVLIYSVRIFTNRSHLSSIPRSWIPIEKGDVRKDVRRMIVEGLERSARIAWRAYPRDLRGGEQSTDAERRGSGAREDRGKTVDPANQLSPEPVNDAVNLPTWGAISHPGWSSPSAPSLANLHFEPIILELPHLIEAKAVSLTPLPEAIPLLRRPAASSLRTYIFHLANLGVLPDDENDSTTHKFLSSYERARFGGKALREDEFRSLMASFAQMLHSVQPLSEDALAELDPTPVATPRLPRQVSLSLHSPHYPPPSSSSGSSLSPSQVRPATSSSSASHFSSTNSLQTTATVEHHPTPRPSNETRHTSRPRRRRADTAFHTPVPDIARFETPNTASFYDVSEGSLAGSEGTVERDTRSRGRSGSRRLDSLRGTGVDRRADDEGYGAGREREHGNTGLGLHVSRTRGSESESAGSVIRLAEAAGPLDLPYVITAGNGTGSVRYG